MQSLCRFSFASIGVVLALGPVSACSEDGGSGGEGGSPSSGDGVVSVLLEPEDVITEGLAPGDAIENIRDGWNVTFDKYVVGIGHVTLALPEDDLLVESHDAFAVDLTTLPAMGQEFWRIEGLAAGRWDFGYHTGIEEAERDDSVDAADFTAMEEGDFTYLIEGRLEKEGGVSCPPESLATPPVDAVRAGENSAGDPCYENPAVAFAFGATAEVDYGPCEIDGLPGVAVAGDQTATVAITLHGDHLFFNGFPEGSETAVLRLAQWLADSDLDLDGAVTRAELEAIAPSDLAEFDDRYQLGGSPITPLDSVYTYVRAQLMTQGHYQGEGECPVNGEAHDH